MGDQEKAGGENEESTLVEAAKSIGSAVGKIASVLGGGAESPAAVQESGNLYGAEYLGSGTFVISKPKRTGKKRRQSQLKNPQRGSRK